MYVLSPWEQCARYLVILSVWNGYLIGYVNRKLAINRSVSFISENFIFQEERIFIKPKQKPLKIYVWNSLPFVLFSMTREKNQKTDEHKENESKST